MYNSEEALNSAMTTKLLRNSFLILLIPLIAYLYKKEKKVDVKNSIKEFLNNKNWEHLLFSYHGIPKRHIKKSDITKSHCKMNNVCCDTKSKAHNYCYRHQCIKTTEAVAKFLKLRADSYSTSFQSRLGPDPWLQPYTDKTLEALPSMGVTRIMMATPGFSSDCVETLEEIAIEGKATFKEATGSNFHMVSCLNDSPAHIRMIHTLIKPYLK